MRHTLLLADDSVTIQRVIELTFADEQVDVVAVSNGDEAIACLQASPPPDIVLADIDMPGRTGYEVAQYIKQSAHLAHIPVLLLTGAFEPVDQARATAAGCDGMLAKPFEPQLVIERVNELLTKSRGAPRPPLDERPASPPAQPAGDLGEYFDRLDAAFASLSSEKPVAGRRPPVAAPESPAHRGQSSSVPVTLPSLADAFAALLAAEQAESPSPASSAWPLPQQRAPAISDDVIEQIVGRVLARLSDRVVRDTVSDVVSTIAERLVREEIDRIKSQIK